METKVTAHADNDLEQGKCSSTAGGHSNLYSHFGNQYGHFLDNWELTYFKTHQLHHSWTFIQRTLYPITRILAQ